MEEKSTGRRIIVVFVLVALICTGLCRPLNADALPYKFKLQQVCAKYPELVVFADLLDADDNTVSLPVDGKLSAKIDGEKFTPISSQVYSRHRDGVSLVYVIDVSAAVSDEIFAKTKEAISEQIKAMPARDYVAIVSAGESAQVLQNLTNQKEVLLATLERLKQDGQRAELKESIIRALDIVLVKNVELPERRLIVIGTAGLNYSASAITDDEIRRKIKSVKVPIYSVVCKPTGKINPSVKKISLGELSRLSGGNFYRNETNGFAVALSDIWRKIDRTTVLKFDISVIEATEVAHELNILYTGGKIMLSDNAQFYISVLPETDKKDDKVAEKQKKIIVFACSGFIGLLLVALCYLLIKHRNAIDIEVKDNVTAYGAVLQNSPVTDSHKKVGTATIRMPVTNGVGVTQRVRPMSSDYHGLSVEFYRTGSSADQRVIRGIISTHTIIGRKATADNCITIDGDSTISARHCEFSFTDGKLYVTDLQSTNGTFVNGVAINRIYPIKDGDLLTIGKTELRVKILCVV